MACSAHPQPAGRRLREPGGSFFGWFFLQTPATGFPTEVPALEKNRLSPQPMAHACRFANEDSAWIAA
jgi:hypothetical protein